MHRSSRFRWHPRATFAIAAFAGLSAATAVAPQEARQAAFIEENNAAMTRMMAGMHFAPSGDIDRDFAIMMIAHHQGAIEMALAQLRYGSNVQLRRIAQEIIVEQQQEIAAMSLAIGAPLPPSMASPTVPAVQGRAGP